MSEAGSSLSVGFFMSYEDALRPFLVKKKGELFVKLPGSDKKWGPVFFGEDGGSPGQDDGIEELFEDELSELLGCQIESFGGEYSWVGFNVALVEDHAGDSYDCTGDISAGASIHLSKMVEMAGRAKSLSKRMAELGYKDLGEPRVYNAVTVMI